jgi:hypothetical protein
LVLGVIEPALGLVAFSWLMWVTMPWAFEERLEFFDLRKKVDSRNFKRRERTITEADVRKARDWLNTSQDEFLGAGVLFLMSGFFDLISGVSLFAGTPTSPPTLNFPFPIDYLTVGTLLGAFFVLGVAVVKAQQVIKFIETPSRVDIISKFASFYALDFAKSMTLALAVVVGLFDILAFILFFNIWFVLFPLTAVSVAIAILDATFALGVVGLIPTFRTSSKEPSRKVIIGPILVTLPWAAVLVFLVVSRLL